MIRQLDWGRVPASIVLSSGLSGIMAKPRLILFRVIKKESPLPNRSGSNVDPIW